jgi:hypothetical protein
MLFNYKNLQLFFQLILAFFILLSVLSCADDSRKSCEQDIPLHVKRYNKEGHTYTVFALAKMAKMDNKTAYNLAIGSELPDILDKYTAFNTQMGDPLHSFHGGDANSINERRSVLLALIKSSLDQRRVDYVEIGIYIHAFGDAYAHTKEYENAEEQAYGALIGHALDGINPDLIALHKEKYLLYTSALLEAFGGSSNSVVYNEFESYVHGMDEQNPLDAAKVFRRYIISKFEFNLAIYNTMLDGAKSCSDDSYMSNVISEIRKIIYK